MPARLLLPLTLVVLATTAVSAEPSELERLGFAKQRVGLLSGYAWGFSGFGSQGTTNAEVDFVALLATWSIGTEPFAAERWWTGNVELQLEAQLLLQTEPSSGTGGGGVATLRYDFLRLDPFFPFVEAGLGVGAIDFDVLQPDGLIFFLQAGAGGHWRITQRFALTLQYRLQHLSNAQTRQPNLGINTHMLLVGPTLFLR